MMIKRLLIKGLWGCLIFFPNFHYTQDFSFLGLSFGQTEEQIMNQITDSKDLIPSEDNLLKQLIPSTPYTLVLKPHNSNKMIQRVFIDFYETRSYQITIFLRPEYFSFYTLSETMLDHYGISDSRNSQKVTWFDNEEQRRATLEYPSVIKFTEVTTLNNVIRLQEQQLEQGISESLDYQEKTRILNEL